MTALGATGKGLFSPQREADGNVCVEAIHGLWDAVHPSNDSNDRESLFQDQSVRLGSGSNTIINIAPSNDTSNENLPIRFYFPESMGIQCPSHLKLGKSFPGTALALYDSSTPLTKCFCRPSHDTFRPPFGSKVKFQMSIGYGAEIGLPHGVQEVWDPDTSNYFIDHIKQVTFVQDPRPPPWLSPPVIQKQQLLYGHSKQLTTAPHNVCRDPSIIEMTAERAFMKPHGCTIISRGRDGINGVLLV